MGKKFSKKNFDKLHNIDDRDYIDKLFDIKYQYFIEDDNNITKLVSFYKNISTENIPKENIFNENDKGYKKYMIKPTSKIIISDNMKCLLFETNEEKYFI